ncbi:hypothetical protein ACQ4PT_070564 [Festuca glaucescens]
MEPTAGAPGLGTPGLSGSSRSWGSSFRQQGLQADTDDPFRRGSASSSRRHDDEEENLRWAALEKLPTYDRMRRAILLGVGGDHHLQGVAGLVEIEHLASGDGGLELLERVFQDDSEQFLRSLRDRVDRVGIEFPAIEVRYQDLSIEVDAIVGSSALPTLWNATTNFLQSLIGRLASSNKKTINILQNVNGILKPSRMTLLLGPPSSGKSTLMRALTGKLDKSLKVSGSITYCGHTFSEFYPERTSAYVSQYDLHNAEMTVRETLDFSRRCLGVGARYDLLAELAKRERDAGIKPDPAIDAYMKATAVQGQETNIVTYLTLKVLGLDICADTMIGDDMVRGISGGQKKRVTTGEMLTGPARALFMDEISTGLDSSSTFQIVKYVKQLVHVMNETVMISLLQPPPETYNLFDDIILISEGYIVYHGPRENILEFFESSGFRCPERKGVADFLQEVTSKKDQQQYWYREQEQYRHVSVPEFAERFKSFHVGQQMLKEMQIPFEKSKTHPAALTTKKYGISSKESLKAVMSREMLLMKRNSFIYIFKVSQLIIIGLMAMTVFLRTKMPSGQISDGGKFFGALTFSLITILFNGFAELQLTIKVLPTFYKQRDLLFFPPWTFGLANILLKVPVSLLEAGVWVILTYFVMGFAPSVGRFFRQLLAFFATHQMALALFRSMGAIFRSMVVANNFGMFTILIIFIFGGFLIPRGDIKPWWIWAYWSSPMMYCQNAISVNEFLASRWASPNNDTSIDAPTVGKAILKSRGLFTDDSGFWLSIGALIGFTILFNILFILALTYLSPSGSSNTLVSDEQNENDTNKEPMSEANASSTMSSSIPMGTNRATNRPTQSRIVLPFLPLSLCFNHINYYVDMPAEMKEQGFAESRLQLLTDISGAFRPGVLTALVGVSGAGKTTLMDVLAGRKTSGSVEGSITLSGYPKKQETFARISGYCEQTDIHSPNVTVYESILYSAWLRLSSDVDEKTRKLLLLKRGGQVIYAGELGHHSHKLVNILRDSQQDLFNLLGATYAAVFFLGASNCFIVQPVVAIERTVFYREKAAGMYSPLSYALAQTSVEVIYNSLQGCLYTIIIYSMVGYEWKADKFLYFLFFIISSFNYFTLFGMMLVALTPSAMLANILTSFVMPLWNLFAGFLVVRMAIPIWWRWYYWADPVAWTIYGVVASQFGESAGTISVPAGASFGEEIPARCSGSAARFPWLHCARPLCLRDCLLLRVRLFHQVLNFQKR